MGGKRIKERSTVGTLTQKGDSDVSFLALARQERNRKEAVCGTRRRNIYRCCVVSSYDLGGLSGNNSGCEALPKNSQSSLLPFFLFE
jgi:hypothetical protein